MSSLNKIDLDDGRFLPLVEEFYSIQGEGYHTGKPAYFVRLGGCDIGCSWCDTRFSWDAGKFPPVSADDLIIRIEACPAQSVVVTGGEPSLYPLDYFTGELKKRKIKTFIETSGAYPLTGKWDWICLSPKKGNPPTDDIFIKAKELKVIIHTEKDLEWAEKNAGKVKVACLLYLQPEWSVRDKIMSLVVDYVKMNPTWNISLQSHKYMRIP